MAITLDTKVENLTRVGKTTANRLKKLGVQTVNDLIFYYPFRHQDLSQVLEIAKIQPGTIVTIKGKIQLIANRRSKFKRKIITEALVSDNTGTIKIIWFNQPFLTKVLKGGDLVYLSGKLELDNLTPQLISPVYEKVKFGRTATHTARIVPVYSITENLTQKQLRFLINLVLPQIKEIKDFLPLNILKKFNLYSLNQALTQIHFPDNLKSLKKAKERLKFNELFLLQLQAQLIKKELKRAKAQEIDFFQTETQKFVNSLPFKLTDDQKKAAWEILKDLQKTQPMNRLLEGEVGSGKTAVAAIVMLNVVLSGFQAVLMAPTEILASQHFNTLTDLFKNFKIRIALLTRTEKRISNQKIPKKKLISEIKEGKVDIILGTQALIQEGVEFKNLILVIVDEQHRFGVAQRKILRQTNGQLNLTPHFLSMTATPIPRSLALIFYGDLDLSIIKELPKERKKIITKIVSPQQRSQTYQFIKEEIKKGRQAFVICPLIDPSDKLGVKAVTDEYEKLNQKIFPELNLGILHGKLKPAEKERAMSEFLRNKISILVATSVVEVGVDIPNATIMIIEGAERFGLAQLYQFRGRVGRSEHQAYCFLFTESQSELTKKRLSALLTAKNAFELSEYDLEFRGPGEIYGVRQSGFLEFKIAKLTDYEIIKQAKEVAQKIMIEDADLNLYPELKQKIQDLNKPVSWE